MYKENRPWGYFERFTKDTPSTVKIITVKKGESLSLQYHKHRQEFWRILKGSPQVMVGNKEEEGGPGDNFFVEKEVKHRISAPVDEVVFLEISFGYFDEEDIVRLEDNYGRVASKIN